MSRRPGRGTRGEDLGGALAALDAPALRALVEDLLLELDDAARSRVVRALVDRAARAGSGWMPAPVAGEDVSELLDSVRAADRVGYAAPRDVDAILDRGTRAFLRRDYGAAHAIFEALLQPIGEGEIDLGQDELVQEVLSADLDVCAAQYAVSAYMVSRPDERAHAVLTAVHRSEAVWYVDAPLRHMERVAVESLPGVEDFLPSWRAAVAKAAADEGRRGWGGPRSWLREVTERTEGAVGLSAIARSSRDAEDLRAWCRRLVVDSDWKGALAAFEAAAELVSGSEYARAEFLDGAALAAQTLGRRDLPKRLEQAWRCDPTLLRLGRWLDSASSRATLRKRVSTALDVCPRKDRRQRAFLSVLVGDLPGAAKLLASAPGLGWSAEQHPGHMIFPLFQSILAGTPPRTTTSRWPGAAWDLDDVEDSDPLFDHEVAADERPRLGAPDWNELLDRVGFRPVADASERGVLAGAMRKAAEKRVAGVTEHKRRRHYGHAALLVAAVAACDSSTKTSHWVASLRSRYSRYPALRRELDGHLGGS